MMANLSGQGLMRRANQGVLPYECVHLRKACFLVALALIAAGGVDAIAASSAEAYSIESFKVTESTTQAGGHPNINYSFQVESHEGANSGAPCHCNDAKDIDLSLPAGLIGNPHAVPQCNAEEFSTQDCPGESQIGVVSPTVDFGGGFQLSFSGVAIYNLEPKPGQAGLIAWEVPFFSTPVYTVLTPRTNSDYGLEANTDGVEQAFAVAAADFELFGVPDGPGALHIYRTRPLVARN